MSAAIKIEIDGELLDRTDCCWFEIAPCGCTCGSALAEFFALDADTAYVEIHDSKRKVNRRQKLGYRLVMGRRSEITDRMFGRCPHVPVWGVTR